MQFLQIYSLRLHKRLQARDSVWRPPGEVATSACSGAFVALQKICQRLQYSFQLLCRSAFILQVDSQSANSVNIEKNFISFYPLQLNSKFRLYCIVHDSHIKSCHELITCPSIVLPACFHLSIVFKHLISLISFRVFTYSRIRVLIATSVRPAFTNVRTESKM